MSFMVPVLLIIYTSDYLAKKEEPIQLEADKWKAARKVRIAQEWKQFEEGKYYYDNTPM